MKKQILIIAIALMGSFSLQAQEFKLGAGAALPVGDAGDGWSFGATVDLAYLFPVAEGFMVGPTAGYKHYFGEDLSEGGFSLEIPDAQFLPIGGTARFAATEQLSFGADLGYAIGISDDNEGGFMYKPFAMYDFGPVAGVFSYSGISLDGGTFSSINLGVEFGL